MLYLYLEGTTLSVWAEWHMSNTLRVYITQPQVTISPCQRCVRRSYVPARNLKGRVSRLYLVSDYPTAKHLG